MGIQSFAGSSVSTEGIVTVKLTGTLNEKSLPVPFSPGNYRIDTGFSGSLRVAFKNAGGTTLSEFTFATTSFFTIADTATTVVVQCPQAAINGIITVQQLKRGVVATPGWQPVALTAVGSNWGSTLQCWNNRVYLLGGVDSASWDGTGGTPSIQYWDKSNSSLTGATTVVRAANSDINGVNSSVIVGDNIYFTRHKSNATALLRYNLTTNTLTSMASRPYSSTLAGLSVNSAGTKIYQFGAYESGADNTRSIVYDIASNSWSSIANIPSGEYSGTSSLADPDNSNIINYFGNSSGKWWRYSISGNTYTDTGYTVPTTYANQATAVNKKGIFKNDNSGTRPNITNFAYYWLNGLNTGAAGAQGYIVPNTIYAPLPEDGTGGASNGGCSFASDSDYVYYHASNSNFLWYISKATFIAGNGL